MISFRPLTTQDFPLLLTWLTKPHVRQWWNDGDDTLEKVSQNFGAELGTEQFLICYAPLEGTPLAPIGYIQACTEEGSGMGIDLFIGEEPLVNRGIGTLVLSAFIRQMRDRYAPAYFVVDPSPDNKRAIRCYEKAGFRPVQLTLAGTDENAYMMRFDCST